MASQPNVLKNQLNRAQVVTRPGHTAIITAMNRVFVRDDPPTVENDDRFTPETVAKLNPSDRWFVELDAVNQLAAHTTFAVTSLDDKIESVMKDGRLSPAGRTEALKEPRTATIKAITAAAADVAAQGQERNARKEKFYGPTPLPPNDVNEALVDRELRDRHFALPLAKRMQSITQMANGQDDRALAALVRSPVPLEANEAALVRDAWHTHVDKREPAKAAELKTALANHTWAEGEIRKAAQFAIRYSGLSPAEIAKAAAGTGGEYVFSSTAADHAA
jgi:hypothetical protein